MDSGLAPPSGGAPRNDRRSFYINQRNRLSSGGLTDEDHRHEPRHERAHARLGRICRQQDVLRAEPADADDRRPAHRYRAPCRHPFRRRHARHRQPQGRHGLAAARLSGQSRRGGRHLEQDVGLGGDHAGDHRERRRRHPRGRYPGPAHRLAQALRGAAAAGPGEVLLLPPRPQPRHAALDAEEEDQMVGAWTPDRAITP